MPWRLASAMIMQSRMKREEAGRPSSEEIVLALQREGIHDARVLDAFRRVHREDFVPPELAARAGFDAPLPIGHDQVTTQPSLMARMVAALELKGGERVLEIGTGLGFQTAVLARLAREVFSVERLPDLARQARANLRHAGVRNATVITGDATRGLPEHAPYDAIVLSAAAPEVPVALADELAEGGPLVQPIGPGGDEVVWRFRKHGGALVRESRLLRAFFVPLLGEAIP